MHQSVKRRISCSIALPMLARASLSSPGQRHPGKKLCALAADFTVWVLFKACTLLSFAYASDKMMYFERLHVFALKKKGIFHHLKVMGKCSPWEILIHSFLPGTFNTHCLFLSKGFWIQFWFQGKIKPRWFMLGCPHGEQTAEELFSCHGELVWQPLCVVLPLLPCHRASVCCGSAFFGALSSAKPFSFPWEQVSSRKVWCVPKNVSCFSLAAREHCHPWAEKLSPVFEFKD